jgi:hypothetical protein
LNPCEERLEFADGVRVTSRLCVLDTDAAPLGGVRRTAELFEERDRKLIALKQSLRGIGYMAGFDAKANKA